MMRATPRAADWIESANATDATAQATRAAPPAGQSHYVTRVVASFSDPAASGLLTLDRGGGNLLVHVHGAVELDFSSPIAGGAGQAVTLSLAAGGAGVVGRVNLVGYTL